MKWQKIAVAFIFLYCAAAACWYASLDQPNRQAFYRSRLHYLHTLFDQEYINAAWYGIKYPSPNYSSREGQDVRFIVLHDTAWFNSKRSLRQMANPQTSTSAHYMIDEKGKIFHLIPEEKAAWHAGISSWHGVVNLNESSIGIELANTGYDHYPKAQMEALAALCRSIIARHKIAARDIVAHSDISPERKSDPGELFDWSYLAKHDIGLWPKVKTKPAGNELRLGDRGPKVLELQQRLARYGYTVPLTSIYDAYTKAVVVAFQRHFRPDRINGSWDADCNARLIQLLQMAE